MGERSIIERLVSLSNQLPDDIIGPGDDCAAFPFNDVYLLLTSDLMNRTSHMPYGAFPEELGRFLMSINLSDIAAMGGNPLGFLTSMSLPASMEMQFIEDFQRGLAKASKQYNCPILGGDTKEGREPVITGTALGTVPKSSILLRRTSKAGDLLAITGKLGRAAPWTLLESDNQHNIKLLLDVTARLDAAKVLASLNASTSCMDCSDGLSATLEAMQPPGLSFLVNGESIPLHQEAKAVLDKVNDSSKGKKWDEMALHMGGDYELVFTIHEHDVQELKNEFNDFTLIGEVVKGRQNQVIKDGRSRVIYNRGYEHLKFRR